MKYLVNRLLQAVSLLLLIVSCNKTDNDNPEIPDKPEVLHYDVVNATYTSTSQGGISRALKICLPSDYDTLTAPLPVFYLFHGMYGDCNSWIIDGKIVTRLDNLYAGGEIEPMVVVMPDCGTKTSIRSGVGPEGDFFVKDMVTDIIPYIESEYHVSALRKDRAVGGLSAGGMQTLNLALFYPEKFAYVYPMSTGLLDEARAQMTSDSFVELLYNPEINNFVKFTFYTGKQDFLFYGSHYQATLALLDDYGIVYDYWEADGGHDWIFWQLSIDRILPELFQEESR